MSKTHFDDQYLNDWVNKGVDATFDNISDSQAKGTIKLIEGGALPSVIADIFGITIEAATSLVSVGAIVL